MKRVFSCSSTTLDTNREKKIRKQIEFTSFCHPSFAAFHSSFDWFIHSSTTSNIKSPSNTILEFHVLRLHFFISSVMTCVRKRKGEKIRKSVLKYSFGNTQSNSFIFQYYPPPPTFIHFVFIFLFPSLTQFRIPSLTTHAETLSFQNVNDLNLRFGYFFKDFLNVEQMYLYISFGPP